MENLAQPYNITIYGLGNLGLAFTTALQRSDFVVTLTGRDLNRVKQQARFLNYSPAILEPRDALASADLVLLTVSDNAIKQVAQAIAPDVQAKTVVAHCSGALSSSELASVQSKDSVSICSLHPLNSLPNPQASIDALSGSHNTTLYSEGDSTALESSRAIFERLGFNIVIITSEAKTLYHAACVMASNYLVALMESSLLTAESAGIERNQFWQSLEPLISSTLTNISDQGTATALSGPIARGDTQTIESHIQALAKLNPQLQSTYADLGKLALELAKTQGALTPEKAEMIAEILKT